MGWNKAPNLRSPIRIDTPSVVSATALRACASFGLVAQITKVPALKINTPSNEIFGRIASSRIVLVTGASGTGKSCTLRGIASGFVSPRAPMRRVGVHVVNDQIKSHHPIIDLLAGPLDRRVATLASAGLAEPRLWAMPASCLSVGERARVCLALAMHRAKPGDVVIADEFATPLDRVNAYSLARTMRRWAINRNIILIAASAHEDLESMLDPDLVIDMNSGQTRVGCDPIAQPIRIELGTVADYKALAHLHYLGPKPATHTLVLRAIRTAPIVGELLAGVLVISMPTLNGSWRDRAWPGFFSSGSKSFNAQQINTHLRCISRVIVEPRSRGLGVASMLVRAYLRSPQTQATEAIAAMGSVCPFFERAGMESYPLLHTRDDLRLLDAIAHTNQTPADLIQSPIEPGSLIARELITWSKARKVIGSGVPDHHTIQRLAPIAACRLLSQPCAYAHVKHQGDNGDGSADT